MNVMDLLYLSFQYIRYHKVKLFVLIFAITLITWLPMVIQSIVDETAEQLMSRAERTPLVIGAQGSALELSLGSLYFKTHPSKSMQYKEMSKLLSTGYAQGIPLNYQFNAQGHPIVGTSQDYLEFRHLKLAQGRTFALLGEAIIGSEVAELMGVKVGDSVISSPEHVFDLAGVYPLKMSIVGILKPSFSPDDRAIFTDIKTTWVIQGLGHGHQDLSSKQSAGQVLKKEKNNLIANASVRQYNEITPENLDSFHFHGDMSQLPVSAILPRVNNKKSAALLTGTYQEERENVQIVRSQKVIKELLETLFTVRDYINMGIVVVGGATATIALFVFFLSLRLRRVERFTLLRIGASQLQINILMAAEIIAVLLISLMLSFLLMYLTRNFGIHLLQQLLLT